MTGLAPATETIRALIEELNATWMAGRVADLIRFFHPDVTFVLPGFAGRVTGRAACLKSYADFLAAATVHEFELGAIEVDAAGDTAVAECPYICEYSLDGRRWRGPGRDLLVLGRTHGQWVVTWRMLMPEAEHEVTPD